MAKRTRRIAPTSRTGRILLLGPTLVAMVLFILLAYSTGMFGGDWSGSGTFWAVMIFLYNVLPSLALAGLVSLTPRQLPKGMPAVAVGTAIFTVFNLYALIPMFVDDSSTGVLLFLFLPLYTGAFVILTALIAWPVHVLRRRRGHLVAS